MSARPPVRLLALAVLGGALLSPTRARAAWPTDPSINVPVSASPTRFTNPQLACEDSCGGIIVAWEDVSNVSQLYVQRVDAFGQPRWAQDGIPVAPPLAMQALFLDIAPDGAGGAYVTWSDQQLAVNMRDVFVQHVLAAGVVDPAWPAAGVDLCPVQGDQKYPAIVADGFGGAIVVWTDERGNVDFAPDIYAQRISATGAPMWPANGVPVLVAPGQQFGGAPAPDGAGGVYVAWADNRSGTFDVYGQHLDPVSGAQLWPAAGLPICAQPNDQSDVVVTSDAGQMLVAWDDYRGGATRDIYAQKLAPNGAIAWPLNGALVCGDPADQLGPRIATDGAGGAVIAWADYRFASFDNALFAQRVGAGGGTLWTAGGVQVCNAPGRQLRPQIISDQRHGAIITWDDFRKNYPQENDADVYAQRVSDTGTPLWTPDGAVVSSANRNQVGPNIVKDGGGGAVIAWQDQRPPNSDTDIYCQEIGDGGLVGVRGASSNCAPAGCGVAYTDFGDAPEGIAAYPGGIVGHFPTCILALAPGTRETSPLCPPVGTPPGPTGYVKHVQSVTDPDGIWLGCNAAGPPPLFVDSEIDGKIGSVGGGGCDPHVVSDCVESVTPGFSVGQDECYGDDDAGLGARLAFPACQSTQVQVNAYGCGQNPVPAFLNVLVDWNHDGDWNDDVVCTNTNLCAPEWAVVNRPVTIQPGCQPVTFSVLAASDQGPSWMRITLSRNAAPADFTWNGSVSAPGGALSGGETEDYPVDVVSSPVGVEPGALRADAWLAPPSPNPGQRTTTVDFTLPSAGHATLTAFDLTGRVVRHLANQTYGAGSHRIDWDFRDDGGADLPAGYYVVRLEVQGRAMTRPVIRMR